MYGKIDVKSDSLLCHHNLWSNLKVLQEGVEYWMSWNYNSKSWNMFPLKWTQMYVCTFEEFILVDEITLLYKYEVIWNGNYTGIYTNIWIAWEELLDVMISIRC